MIKAIIFDFDGVLADSFDAYYDFNKAAFASFSVFLSKKAYRDLFNGNVHGGFRSLIKDDNQYERFLNFRLKNFDKFHSKTTLFAGAVDLVKKISKGHILAIVSSSPLDKIKKILKKYKAQKYFDIIFGNNDHSKKNYLEKVIQDSKSTNKEVVMITDTVGDIKIAKELGIKTIAVSWGFHSYATLKTSKPNFIVKNFSQLLKVLD